MQQSLLQIPTSLAAASRVVGRARMQIMRLLLLLGAVFGLCAPAHAKAPPPVP
jgi:hypothetical protein